MKNNLFLKLWTAFRDNKLAAVTVDWVVLSASMVLLAYGAVTYIDNGLKDIESNLAEGVANADDAALGN